MNNPVKNVAHDLLHDCAKLKSLLNILHEKLQQESENNDDLMDCANLVELGLEELKEIQEKIDTKIYLKIAA